MPSVRKPPGLLRQARPATPSTRNGYDQPVQLGRDFDLAAQAAVAAHLAGSGQHPSLDIASLADDAHPCIVDVDLARRTTAGAATLGGNTFDEVVHCTLHDRTAHGNIHFERLTICLDIFD